MKPNGPAIIRVLLVDDAAVVRKGIRSVIASHGRSAGIEVVGEVGTAAEAIAQARRLAPDVVLLDIRLPDGSGVEVCREILRHRPGTCVLMLTSFAADDMVYNATAAGARGYLLKEIDAAALIAAIESGAAGRTVLVADAAERVLRLLHEGPPAPAADNLSLLSPQELRVLAMIAEGFTNREAGERLRLSENTVKSYLIRVFEKLRVKRRAQAAAIYVRATQTRTRPEQV